MRRYELVNPFSLFHELDRSFGHFFNEGNKTLSNQISPVSNVREEKDYYLLSLDVPGIHKDDLKVELKENVLSILGERKSKYQNDQGEYDTLGSFDRSFGIPKNVDLEQIEVTHENGVLEILLPKTNPKNEIKNIEIKSGTTQTFTA